MARENILLLGAALVLQINHLDKPCKPEVVGWIPGFSSLSDETLSCGSSPYDLRYWWDVQHKQTNMHIARNAINIHFPKQVI